MKYSCASELDHTATPLSMACPPAQKASCRYRRCVEAVAAAQAEALNTMAACGMLEQAMALVLGPNSSHVAVVLAASAANCIPCLAYDWGHPRSPLAIALQCLPEVGSGNASLVACWLLALHAAGACF